MLGFAGAPSIATNSGEFTAGNAKANLAEAPHGIEPRGPPLRLSSSLEMIGCSSKVGRDPEGWKTPARASNVEPAHEIPPAQDLPPFMEIEETPALEKVRPSQAKPVPTQSPLPASASHFPDIRKELFGPRSSAPSRASQAPKPEGYWR